MRAGAGAQVDARAAPRAPARSARIASSATPSVSGRGTNTPRPTSSSRWRNGASPSEVLQRHARGPAHEQRLEAHAVGRVDGVGQEHPAARHAEHVGEQQLGVDPRRGHPGAGEAALAVDEHVAQGAHAAASSAATQASSPSAAMRAARSASTQACTSASSSPSSTASRL